ncbi:hypothetical protein DU972_001098 [Vibrio mimicus]
MVLVSWCLIFNALMHQKDPGLHYFGASLCCSAPCLPKRLLFRAQLQRLSMTLAAEKSQIAKHREQNEEKNVDFSATDHIFLGFSLKSGTLLAVFEPCSATALAASLNEK